MLKETLQRERGGEEEGRGRKVEERNRKEERKHRGRRHTEQRVMTLVMVLSFFLPSSLEMEVTTHLDSALKCC
jgi:hypothetical protein